MICITCQDKTLYLKSIGLKFVATFLAVKKKNNMQIRNPSHKLLLRIIRMNRKNVV